MLKLKFNEYEVWLIDEPMYSLNSVDNVRSYELEYILSDDNHFDSKHGIRLVDKEEIVHSCLLVASGWGTGIHSRTAEIVEESIYVAVGSVLCSLRFSFLDLQWKQKVDFVTCFGVYYLPNKDCLITHGECDISCITRNGNLVWNKSGKDIFTEGFEIKGDYIDWTFDKEINIKRFAK